MRRVVVAQAATLARTVCVQCGCVIGVLAGADDCRMQALQPPVAHSINHNRTTAQSKR